MTTLIFAGTAEAVRQVTLENGLEVFLLENKSDALVNIEFECRAGFSSQNQETNGFFKLYTRLIQASNPEINFTDRSCNADSSRYSLTTSPQQIERILQCLAEAFFNPEFSDEVLTQELSILKKEVAENAETMSYYINAAIDSRVFSEAPWKHDSGIYPPLFNKSSQKQARTILNQISKRWYIPQNCALFISGNINSERLEILLKNSFGRFYSASPIPQAKEKLPLNKQKKFVFHSKEISPDLTQLVIEYTMLSADQCDLLARLLNDNNSTFKTKLIENARLNIPGDEYINAQAIHEKENSRLIIQTLLQKPEDKKLKLSSALQAEEFIAAVADLSSYVNEAEFLQARQGLLLEMEASTGNARTFMTALADFWVREPYVLIEESDSYPLSPLVAAMKGKQKQLGQVTLQQCLKAIEAENPFTFVIIHSDDFKANKKQYSQGYFEEINEGNSSWYLQELFKELRQISTSEEIPEYITSRSELQDNNYTQTNLAQFYTKVLSNGIEVVSKENPLSNLTSLLISIKGGKYNSADNHGFEEVMIQLLSGMIERELYAKASQGLITYLPQVKAKTDLATSSITVEFLLDDAEAVCNAIVNAVIYGEIPPAMADRAVSARQYRKRLENGSAVNQIYYGAIGEIFKGSSITKVFETENDILQSTDYMSILSAYPQFLDARRYSLILTGKLDASIYETVEKSFGQLSKSGKAIEEIKAKAILQKGRSKTIKVVHTFLTDIPAEEAGPMPAELIPTTEFLDPVIYIYKAPLACSREAALYSAILNYLEDFLQKKCQANGRLAEASVEVVQPRNALPFGAIILEDVRHTKEADAMLRGAVSELKKLLGAAKSAEATVTDIKVSWNIKQMNKTGSDSGTASLIQKGFELSPEKPEPEWYLTEYNYIQKADAQDFLKALSDFSEKPNLSVYSQDSQK
ncbi:MAG: insulinase family protein [Treponema sp.]|nr:insulinase family protein [Treponema sp.]